MRHEYDSFIFPPLRGRLAGQSIIPSRFAGLPVGIEIFDRWMVQMWDPGNRDDQFALVDVPATPDETVAGRGWVQTQLTGSTITLVDTGFPPFLRIATPAASGQGQQMQAAVGATGNTRALYSTSTATDLFFSITMRLSDANNNANTVEQVNLFAGFGAIDTSVLAGLDDYMGFAIADGSGIVKMVADQTSGVPTTGASSSVNIANLSTAASGGQNLINKWFTLTMVATGLSRTSQTGNLYGFLDYAAAPPGASKRPPTFRGELDLSILDDVAGADMTPTIAFTAGEAVVKNLDIAKIVCAAAYRLGA